MCGRYVSAKTGHEIARLLNAEDATGGQLAADFNVAPTKPAATVKVHDGARRAGTMRWGFVFPAGPAQSGGVRRTRTVINARLETVAERPAFRDALRRRRCLVPADGYYEWQQAADGAAAARAPRQPYFLTDAALAASPGELLTFAGLYQRLPATAPVTPVTPAETPAREWGFVILTTATTPADGPAAAIHDRRPVVVPARLRDAWLTAVPERLAALLAELAACQPPLAATPVGPQVGNVRNNGPALLRNSGPELLRNNRPELLATAFGPVSSGKAG